MGDRRLQDKSVGNRDYLLAFAIPSEARSKMKGGPGQTFG